MSKQAGRKILKYVIFDILRNKLVIAYTLLLLILSITVINLGRDSSKAIVSLLNVVMFLVPLVSIIFGTIHFYNSREFIEMLLALPVNRKSIFWAEYLGLSASLSTGFLIGIGLPLLIYGGGGAGLYLVVTGVFLTFIFTAIAFLSSVINADKARGIGVSLMLWFYFSVLFDGIVLMIYMFFSDYPLQKVVIILAALNPIDLARIMILLKLDISALLGYTGATFQYFFGSVTGLAYSLGLLFLWAILPTLLALRSFNRRNF
jgi:Cu-processing system permease protein